MDRACSHCQDQVYILLHVILHDLYCKWICMKSLCVQHKYLTAVIDIFHDFLCHLACICVTDQKR